MSFANAAMNGSQTAQALKNNAPRPLYAAMLLQFAVGGAILPFISMLFRDKGLDFTQMSRIFFASSSTLLVFPFFWGMLADRFISLNRLFILLNVLASGCLIALSGQRSFYGMLLSFTFFYACFHPTMTLINALCFHHLSKPQEQFAKLRAWGSAGWILPSLPIYLWIAKTHTSELSVVVYLGLGLAVAMALIGLTLPYTPPGSHKRSSLKAASIGYWPAMKLLLRNRNYVILVAAFFLVTSSYSISMYYSPPFLEDHGVRRAWIGPIQCIGVVTEVILFRCLSQLIARWNYSRTILLGCACLIARHLLFAFCDNPWILSVSYILTGMLIVFFTTTTSILVNALATEEVKATAQTSLIFFGSGMGPMFSNWIAGLLAANRHNNLRPVFLFAACLAGIAGLLVLARGSKLNHIPER